MVSVLSRIERYVEDYGIPFDDIPISSYYFPEYFNQVVLEELNKVLPRGCTETEIKEYILSISENHELKLTAYAKNNYTRIVIFPEDRPFDYSVVGKKLSEFAVIEEAKKRERTFVNELRWMIGNKKLMKEIDISLRPFSEALKRSANLCMAYIDELNKMYQEKLRSEENQEKEMIRFVEADTSTIIRRSRIGSNGRVERVNSILPVDERMRVLESYPYIYSGYAYAHSSREIDYLNYLYSLGDNDYAIVMEPYNRTKATRVQLIHSTSPIDKAYFNMLVKSALNLPFSVLCEREDIKRLYHSTIDSFDNKLAVIITGKSKTVGSCLKKEKVKQSS